MKISRYLPIIGITIFVLILWSIGIIKIIDKVKEIDILFFILSLIPTAISIMLKGLKWKILIDVYEVDYPLKKSIEVWLIGFSAGLITPGRFGDFLRAVYLKDDKNLPLGRSLTTVVVDRCIDILFLFIIAFFGMFMFATIYNINDLLPVICFFFICFICSIYIVTKKQFISLFIKPFFNTLTPEKYRPKLKTNFNEFYDGIKKFKNKKTKIIISSLLALLSWFFVIIAYYFIALSVGINISIYFLVFVIPLVTIIEIIPVSISGFGTRDATLIFFFSLVSVPMESAMSFSILMLSTYILTGIIGFFLWIKNPVKLELYHF